MAQQIRLKTGRPNWVGLWTLYSKEVRRFAKIYTQTIVAPGVGALVFLAIFAIALKERMGEMGGVPFIEFLAPGLIVMTMAQNAYANSSSSIMISKMQGNIVDVLMPPLSAQELTLGYSLGGASRGIAVGVAVTVILAFFVNLPIHNVGYILFHTVAASLMLSLLGVISAIWAEKFDHINAVTNFVVQPLTFLSGTFYTIERLPESIQAIAHFNPFFYMIDGFRYGFIGHADADPLLGIAVLSGMNVALWLICHRMLVTGYKLKA